MYDNSEQDRQRTLRQMMEIAIQRRLHNRIEARDLVAEWISHDRRFDGLDPAKLAQRVDEQRSNGARIDLNDPRLRGQPARPLTRDTHW